MKFTFFSAPTFEPWDWGNPEFKGIGGSETSHIELARRLAEAGHEVYSYAPVPFVGERTGPGGVIWKDCREIDGDRDGVWVVYREPAIIPKLPGNNPVWLICQDINYGTIPQAGERLTRIVALCPDHADYLRGCFPGLAHKVCISANGIHSDRILSVLNTQPYDRDPQRLLWASSPDRGLWYLLMILERAQELLPDLELHVCYGFDNMEKLVRDHPESWMAQKMAQLKAKLKAARNVHYHGRLTQPELLRQWAMTGIWCHPSVFPETSCITSMEAQAMGAIPITTPIWGIAENVRHGVFIEGSPQDDPLTRARYVRELVAMASDPGRQQSIRTEMMRWALYHFDWTRVRDQWIDWAEQDLALAAETEAA